MIKYLFTMSTRLHILILIICVLPSSVTAKDLTAGKLYEICQHDRIICNSILVGLAQGLVVGSGVGAIGTAKQIVGKKHKIISDLSNLRDKNTGIFLGFCEETSMKNPGYVKPFIEYVEEHPDMKIEIAAYVLLFAMQKSFPISDCQK